MKLGKFSRFAATSVLAVAGFLAFGSLGSTAMAAESDQLPQPDAAVTNAVGQIAGTSPLGDVADLGAIAPLAERAQGAHGCPAQVPSHPTGADYVNAWNESGTCFGAGAAGLVSSAWAGAIPSITQGAMGGLG